MSCSSVSGGRVGAGNLVELEIHVSSSPAWHVSRRRFCGQEPVLVKMIIKDAAKNRGSRLAAQGDNSAGMQSLLQFSFARSLTSVTIREIRLPFKLTANSACGSQYSEDGFYEFGTFSKTALHIRSDSTGSASSPHQNLWGAEYLREAG